MELVAKIEAADSLPNLDSIIEAADGVMVARGDLGAQVRRVAACSGPAAAPIRAHATHTRTQTLGLSSCLPACLPCGTNAQTPRPPERDCHRGARPRAIAQIPVEDVPNVQKYVAVRGRQLGKPVIVAHQLLQSMME